MAETSKKALWRSEFYRDHPGLVSAGAAENIFDLLWEINTKDDKWLTQFVRKLKQTPLTPNATAKKVSEYVGNVENVADFKWPEAQTLRFD